MLRLGQIISLDEESYFIRSFNVCRNSRGHIETLSLLSKNSQGDLSESDFYCWVSGTPYDLNADFIDIWTDGCYPTYVRINDGSWEIKKSSNNDGWVTPEKEVLVAIINQYREKSGFLDYYNFVSMFEFLNMGNTLNDNRPTI